jgi:hypothetical protein
MHAAYKTIPLILLMGWQSFAIGQGANAYGIFAGDCSDESECVVVLHSQNLALRELCDSTDFSVSWTQGADKYLIQCRSRDTSEDNVVWVVDRKMGLFFRLNYGRFIKKSALEKNPNMEVSEQVPCTESLQPDRHTKAQGK